VTAGVTTYDLVDTSSGNSLLTGGAGPAPLATSAAYQSRPADRAQVQGAEAGLRSRRQHQR
jgi:hypothetical protein